MSRWDAAVIGSGIGGLSCAAALAAKGRRVLVLEQALSPGGYLATFRRGEFAFDAAVDCIAGLEPGGIFTGLLSSLGVNDRLRRIRLDPIRVSLFPGLTVRVDAESSAYIERLSRLFPAERKGIAAFFRRAGEIYDDVSALMGMVREEADETGRLPAALLRYREATFAELLREDIRDPRVAAVLSDRCPFLGVSPRRASAVGMAALVRSYFRSGAWRPAGGHQRLPELLVEGIRNRGGAFLPGKPARRILVEGGRCVGVETDDGDIFRAGHVVSNADLHETFGRLLPGREQPGLPGAPGSPGVSPSFFIVYAGVKGELPAGETASSIGAFDGFDLDRLLDRYVPFRDSVSLGVTIPTVEDPSLAPPGHHVFLIHELVPPGYPADWRTDKEPLARKVLGKAERIFPGLSTRLARFEAATPATLSRYTRNRDGAAFGWDQVPRLPRLRAGVRNLHLAGHWTEFGGGVLAAAFSGVRTAARILREGG